LRTGYVATGVQLPPLLHSTTSAGGCGDLGDVCLPTLAAAPASRSAPALSHSLQPLALAMVHPSVCNVSAV